MVLLCKDCLALCFAASPVSCAATHAEGSSDLAGRAFQRVKADEWLDQKGSLNNSYQATFGDEGWGAKAQQVLGQVSLACFQRPRIAYYLLFLLTWTVSRSTVRHPTFMFLWISNSFKLVRRKLGWSF